MEEEKEKLISIDDLITKAKAFGVDFGKGDPKNRLRYYVKIGLLPHAKRKSFNDLPPTGAFPIEVLSTLISIDRKIKEGKSILEIKRELEKEKLEKEEKKEKELTIKKLHKELFELIGEEKEEKKEVSKEKVKISFKEFFKKNVFWFGLSFGFLLFFIFVFAFAKNYLISMSAALPGLSKIFKPKTEVSISEKREEIFPSPPYEPYLTLNTDTEINGKLILNDTLFFQREGYQAFFDFETLTQNRNYKFPDASGIVCLNTGNCAFLYGDVKTPGGTINRLAKFSGAKEISNSSILDNYAKGISIFIDENGNVGIGTQAPTGKLDVGGTLKVTGGTTINGNLDVSGKIHATGDICTDEAGGKCLSRMITWFYGGGGGISGSGQAGYLPIWLAGNRLGQSILSQNGNEISISGILDLAKASEPSPTLGFGKIFVGNDGKLYFKDESGNLFDLTAASQAIQGQGGEGQLAIFSSASTLTSTSSLSWDNQNQILNVDGTIVLKGFRLIPGAGEGKVLMSDAQGYGTWASLPPGTMPPGTLGQTMWHDGTTWTGTSFLYNRADLQKIGIGTTTLSAMLTLAGDFNLAGPLQITDFLGQYFKISLLSDKAQIESTKDIVINSLTGQILTGPNVTLFDASSSTIKGLTFISADNDSTVRKSGEKVLRTMIPIFKFPLPAQTTSTSFVAITREISTSTLNSLLPSQLPGSQRKFAILLNFADNIPTNNYSYWQIDFSNLADINFQFSGQGLSNLDEGISHLKDDLTNLLNDNWTLKVKVENANYKIRIFNAFLIVYDQIQ